MEDLGTIEIVRGEDFSKTFYLGTYKNIEASSSANPSVITVTNHGYTNSTKKQITGHQGNTVINNSSDNPFHTITTIDANTFSVPVDGAATGGATGRVLTPTNLTGATVECQFRSVGITESSTPTGNVLFEPTVAVVTAAEGSISITIEKALTYSNAVGGLTLKQYQADILVQTSGGVDSYYAKFKVKVVESVSRI